MLKIQEAMLAAKARSVAAVRAALDQAGPHLGPHTQLLFPVGRLLQLIGEKVRFAIAPHACPRLSDPSRRVRVA